MNDATHPWENDAPSEAPEPFSKSVQQMPARLRFELVPFDQIKLSSGPRALIKNLIPREGLVVVWGPPKCGKTFIVSDLALHVALGWPYRERRVCQGNVVYLSLEGDRGVEARVEAFRQEKLADATSPVTFFLISTRLDLAADHRQLIADIRAQIPGQEIVAVIIDTLNRSLAGSENSDEDMGRYIRGADAVRDAFRCAVIVIHHCGIDETRPRGHSSLFGSLDAQIAVRRDDESNVVATLEHMKDGPSGVEWSSRLQVVEIGLDEDGEPITSCVVEPAEKATSSKSKQRPLSAGLKLALERLDDLLAREGKAAPSDDHYPQNATVVSVKSWREHLRKSGAIPEEGPAERQGWRRAREGLLTAGRIGVWDPYVWRVAS